MNKTIVLTGGTKGIGKAIIEKFAANGFDIITCARNEEDLAELKEYILGAHYGIIIETFKADMSIKDEVIAFAQYCNDMCENVDVLVNNAGVFEPGNIHEEEDGKLEKMMNTNLYSAYHLSRQLIPGMIKHESGDIFNICSVASTKAYPNGGSYSISKFAMYGLSQGLREELKPHGIRVVSVLPGATYTASWEGVDLPEERFMKASDVADSVWGAYALSRQSVIEDLVIRPQLGDI